MPMHLLSPCSRIVYHGHNVRRCTGLRSGIDVVLNGFSSRLSYSEYTHTCCKVSIQEAHAVYMSYI